MGFKLATRIAAVSALVLATLPPAMADNVPPGVKLAEDLGIANPAEPITITVHLKIPNQPLFDRTVDALYNPASPRFHKWLTDADLRPFAPSSQAVAAVRATLEGYGLTILSKEKYGFSMRARGPLAAVARAFNTEIHVLRLNDRIFRANTRNAQLAGTAGSYVHAVAGIESHSVQPLAMRARHAAKPVAVKRLALIGGFAGMITEKALTSEKDFLFTIPNEALPTASYAGLVYDTNANLMIGFTPTELQLAYNLPAAYKLGLTGAGQTIVLLEAFGYPTNESDANAFFRLAKLPTLNSTNFKIVYPEGKPANPQAGVNTGWDIEIALDTQWSHSMAPGANIVIVATNGQDNEDFEASMTYIVDNDLGAAVSDSWLVDQDTYAGPDEQAAFEDILQLAAAKGISFQFATGDRGDAGLGTPLGAPGVPSVAPHATAVGGTALLNTPGTAHFFPVGWGNAAASIASHGPVDPPNNTFIGGGGGGESIFWPKPTWQSGLPGTGRQTPDISALADPYTGVPIVVTESGRQVIEAGWGGTSLASPIVTAIWAIAQQKAGKPLGQAAQTIASLTTGLTDVVPVTSATNVSGRVTDAAGITDYTSAALLKGLIPHRQHFIDAVWNEDPGIYLAFAFALDSSFVVTKGWDNATGYGTPQDALAFINAAAAR
jgi:subtilase family serine protease